MSFQTFRRQLYHKLLFGGIASYAYLSVYFEFYGHFFLDSGHFSTSREVKKWTHFFTSREVKK